MQRLGLGILGLVVLMPVACSSPLLRLQSEDEDLKERARTVAVRSIGDVTTVAGAQPIQVYGIGVVTNLQGTGSDPEPGPVRQAVIRDIKQRGVKDPEAFLASGDVAVVKVTALLMPGTHKGDDLDVDVELDGGDRASSLRGGYLMPCELREYADARELSGGKRASAALAGRVLAKAEGPILAGLGEGSDGLRRGRVWGGGRSTIERPFVLCIKQEGDRMASARLGRQVAISINQRFHAHQRGSLKGMAEARDNVVVTLKIPNEYKNNWPRYLRVIKHLPLREDGAQRAGYQHELGQQLQDPAKAIVAALKLEALGADSIPILQRALTNANPTVRFAAAEALAYLGDPSCAEPLGQLAANDPRFRAYALAALASLDESICHVTLRKLLQHQSAETRYGAFQALRSLDPQDSWIPGVLLNDSFYLHRVAVESPPLVHVSTRRRAEIVLFGQDQHLRPPFALQAGADFLVTANEGEQECTVARISARDGSSRQTCSFRVQDVIVTLGNLGAQYADVVELLLQASRYQLADCSIVVDAVPQAPSLRNLAFQGLLESGEGAAETSEEPLSVGMTPNLFAMPETRPGKNRAAADGD